MGLERRDGPQSYICHLGSQVNGERDILRGFELRNSVLRRLLVNFWAMAILLLFSSLVNWPFSRNIGRWSRWIIQNSSSLMWQDLFSQTFKWQIYFLGKRNSGQDVRFYELPQTILKYDSFGKSCQVLFKRSYIFSAFCGVTWPWNFQTAKTLIWYNSFDISSHILTAMSRETV